MSRNRLYVCAGILLLAYLSVSSVYACRPIERPSAAKLLSGAEFIVRATAVKYLRKPKGEIRYLNTPDDAEIEFRVEEVIKGKKVPATIALNGYLTDKNDYNDRPVPYDFVRPNGRHGSCFAYEYRKGSEFLLFLEKRENKFTLYPQALGPINEQIRSEDDEWLLWVRDQVKNVKN
jgi:hypothetical protein